METSDILSSRILYRDLIKEYGKGKELHTFEICSNTTARLNNSTIDKIVEEESGEIVFYYNENTKDFAPITDFNYFDLVDFATSIAKQFCKTTELCSHCGDEVILDGYLGIYLCPNCGRPIINCSKCKALSNGVRNACKNCVLEYQLKQYWK